MNHRRIRLVSLTLAAIGIAVLAGCNDDEPVGGLVIIDDRADPDDNRSLHDQQPGDNSTPRDHDHSGHRRSNHRSDDNAPANDPSDHRPRRLGGDPRGAGSPPRRPLRRAGSGSYRGVLRTRNRLRHCGWKRSSATQSPRDNTSRGSSHSTSSRSNRHWSSEPSPVGRGRQRHLRHRSRNAASRSAGRRRRQRRRRVRARTPPSRGGLHAGQLGIRSQLSRGGSCRPKPSHRSHESGPWSQLWRHRCWPRFCSWSLADTRQRPRVGPIPSLERPPVWLTSPPRAARRTPIGDGFTSSFVWVQLPFPA